jgi:hypothetical protein
MLKEKPNFYAILPASVRYDTSLSSSQKIFYAEITALSNKQGYCWASNSYFAELYSVSTSTISGWVKGLQQGKHIIVEYERRGKEVIKRNIYPIQKIDHPYSENTKGVVRKHEEGWSENLKENNTRDNTTSNNTIYVIPEVSDVREYFEESGKIPDSLCSIEAENFMNHYEEREWKNTNGKRIKEWKRQASTWVNNYFKWNKNGTTNRHYEKGTIAHGKSVSDRVDKFFED